MDVIPDANAEDLPADQNLRAGDDAGTPSKDMCVMASDILAGLIILKFPTDADRQPSPGESRCWPQVVGDWICTCLFSSSIVLCLLSFVYDTYSLLTLR